MPADLVTDTWFGSKKRPKEFGSVTIKMEEIPRSRGARIIRPTSVSGIVAPGATSGRASAPEPLSGLRVSQAKAVPVKYRYDSSTGENAYNTGIPDAEKGHIMALELGGPDIPQNIVPQWAKWQGTGVWRRMEVAIKEDADQGLIDDGLPPATTKRYYLQFHGLIQYVPFLVPSQAGHRRLAFPARFTVYTTRLHFATKAPIGPAVCVFDASPSRNETDDMIAMRTFMQVEEAHGGSDWDPGYDDWMNVEETKKGKKRNVGDFTDSGQDARYVPIPKITYSNSPFDLDAYASRLGMKLELNKLTNLNLDTFDEDEATDPTYTRPKKKRRVDPTT
jgi:hypothetical protein